MEKFENSPESDRKDRQEIKRRRAKARRRRKFACILTVVTIAGVLAVLMGVAFKKKASKSSSEENQKYVTVTTDSGKVRGRVVELPNRHEETCSEFYNIPYAEPPVGDLRWKNPVPLRAKWSAEYPADKVTTKMCTQPVYNPDATSFDSSIGEEDCLYLTVLSPNLTTKLPVMVWIHGGGLITSYNGQPGYAPTADLAIDLNVVTVSINYRLGHLGFLSLRELWNTTPGHESYGNFGFMDQVAALRWVKNNIANFGGDPKSVTIIGESAGGTSVMALAGSPLANNLFHRVIAQSPTAPLFNHTTMEDRMRRFYLPRLGCNGLSSQETTNCLYTKSAKEITIATSSWAKSISSVWGLPEANETVEGLSMTDPAFLPVSPLDMKSLTFIPKQQVPIVISTMAQEVGFSPQATFKDNEWVKMHNHVQNFMNQFNASLLENLFALYPNQTNENITLPPQKVYETLTTDLRWTCPSNRLALSVSESIHHKAYRMYISHHPMQPSQGRRFAFHAWDSFAFFEHSGKLSPHKNALKSELRSLFKRFIHNGTLAEEWRTFPGVTGELTNSKPWLTFLPKPIQQEQCNFWDSNGFQRYRI